MVWETYRSSQEANKHKTCAEAEESHSGEENVLVEDL